MRPLWWMQSTGSHWTVIAVEFRVDSLTKVGGADGAGGIIKYFMTIIMASVVSLDKFCWQNFEKNR